MSESDLIKALRAQVASRPLAESIGGYDFEHGDQLYLKFGGEGDNGEALIEAIDARLAPLLERLIAVVESADVVCGAKNSVETCIELLRQDLADLRAAVLPIAHETGKTKISRASGKEGK
jgi:hypothetical protein